MTAGAAGATAPAACGYRAAVQPFRAIRSSSVIRSRPARLLSRSSTYCGPRAPSRAARAGSPHERPDLRQQRLRVLRCEHRPGARAQHLLSGAPFGRHRGDHRPAGHEVRGQLGRQAHIEHGRLLGHREHIGGGQHIGEVIGTGGRQEGQRGDIRGEPLQMRALVAVPHEHEPHGRGFLTGQPRGLDQYLQALFQPHVPGVQHHGLPVGPPQPCAGPVPVAARARHMRPVGHHMHP